MQSRTPMELQVSWLEYLSARVCWSLEGLEGQPGPVHVMGVLTQWPSSLAQRFEIRVNGQRTVADLRDEICRAAQPNSLQSSHTLHPAQLRLVFMNRTLTRTFHDTLPLSRLRIGEPGPVTSMIQCAIELSNVDMNTCRVCALRRCYVEQAECVGRSELVLTSVLAPEHVALYVDVLCLLHSHTARGKCGSGGGLLARLSQALTDLPSPFLLAGVVQRRIARVAAAVLAVHATRGKQPPENDVDASNDNANDNDKAGPPAASSGERVLLSEPLFTLALGFLDWRSLAMLECLCSTARQRLLSSSAFPWAHLLAAKHPEALRTMALNERVLGEAAFKRMFAALTQSGDNKNI